MQTGICFRLKAPYYSPFLVGVEFYFIFVMYVHHQSTNAIHAALLPLTDSPRMALGLAVSLFPVCHCRSVFALLYLALRPA